MTETTATSDATGTPTDATDAPQSPDQPTTDPPTTDVPPGEQTPGEDNDDDTTSNREAARYRRRLRDTEAERNQLATHLDIYRRRDAADYAAAAGMINGADLFAAGVDLGELIGDDGTVDRAAVEDVTAQVLADRPHWRRLPAGDAGQGPRATVQTGVGWADVLKKG